jgi:hypothetical protein
MRLHKTLLLISLMSALILSSCGGVTPDNTVNHSDGAPVVKPTLTPTSSPVSSYAFVRQGQLWVSFNGRNPEQVTHLDYRSLGPNPNIFWRQPLWSPGDGFLAFIMRAMPAGIGGGGVCPPGLNYAYTGALYIMNTSTLQITRVALPSNSSPQVDNNPLSGYWEHIFWEDATHLLAFSISLQSNTNGSLFRYDLNRKILSEVIPASSLRPFIAGIHGGDLIWFPLRYSSGQLFYQVIEADPQNSKNIKFVIYSHSTLHPELPNTKVLDTGSEPLPDVGPNVPPCPPFTNPGWDISPDGKRLVAQMLLTDNAGHVSSSIRALKLNLSDGSMVTLFGQVSSNVFKGDFTLTWAPDNQSALLTSWSSQVGPYSATLLQPEQTQAYPPDTTGHVVWRSDSSAFALFQFQQYGMVPNNTANVYMFVPGKPGRRLFLANAFNFAWG